MVSLNESTGTKSNWSTSEDGKTKSATVTFDEGVHTLNVTATDKARNVSEPHNESFVIDMTAPTVTVIREGATGYTNTGVGTEYVSGEQTIKITVADTNIDTANSEDAEANVTYAISSTSTEHPAVAETTAAMSLNNAGTAYEFTINLEDGQTLTKLSVEAVDNAGNAAETVTATGMSFSGMTYNGNKICVDTTAPKVTINRASDDTTANTYEGHDFYSKPVTYTITVEDANLIASLKKDEPGFVNDGSYLIEDATVHTGTTERTAISWEFTGTTKMEGTISVASGKKLDKNIILKFKDAAGNAATRNGGKFVTNDTGFAVGNDGSIVYSGNHVVADEVAPEAIITFEPADQLDGYYTDGNGVTYLKLKTPTTDANAKDEKTVEISMHVTVNDYNLGIVNGSLTGEKGTWNKGAGTWKSDTFLINDSTGTAVYTQTVSVKTNSTGQIQLDPQIVDLAGNVIKTERIKIANVNNTVAEKTYSVKADTAGKVSGRITLDRRQPTSDDNSPPQIKLEPTVKPVGTTGNGIQLFNGSFGFVLNVNDGENDTLNAGLKPMGNEVNGVSWTLTNEGNGDFVKAKSTGLVHESHTHNETISIDAGNGECNTFKLTVTAIDNVGNTITYQEAFAVDTLAPRITVEFDNNDVRNDRYFRAERTATIIVDELNFDEAKTDIETQIEHGAWGVDAQGRHVTSVDYNTDGDYTLHVSSTDLAGNHTADGGVDYFGVACQEFTIDLTLPIIEVFYDPEIVSGVDEEGVEYYNADQHIGVRIIEHNFSENDVVDEFYINRDQPLGRGLGEFTDNGDNHNAAIVLENGNRYFFRVNYTDLAGNVADGYTSNYFSVDTVPPTIRTISELDNEQMNVVSGDLELQFVINDAQDNLDNVHVVITHTNNSFETVMVSGPEFLTITPQKDRSTVTVNIANIQKLKNLDGIYTIELRAYDYAGNIVTLTPPMVISLNRFGSTFTTDDPFTKQFLTPGSDGVVYHNSVNGNLIIQEINPNRVFHDETLKEEGSVLTIVVNGRSIRLEEGVDYTMTVEKRGQEGSYWYCYTYEIDKKVFEEDGELRNGRYSILIYGVDEAGNNNTNESSEYSTLQPDGNGKYTGKIEFTIDTQAPVIITTGIESNEIYNEEFRQMQIEIADATPTFVQVYLNEELVALSVDATNLPENSLWLTQDKETGIYTLNVNEQSGIFSSQNVRIVATDAAANAAEAEVNDFHISTSFLVRMLNSIWFYVILVAVAAGVVLLIVFSRKKKAAV